MLYPLSFNQECSFNQTLFIFSSTTISISSSDKTWIKFRKTKIKYLFYWQLSLIKFKSWQNRNSHFGLTNSLRQQVLRYSWCVYFKIMKMIRKSLICVCNNFPNHALNIFFSSYVFCPSWCTKENIEKITSSLLKLNE